jgi:hypothetical protein
VVTGRPGAGDLLVVRYVNAHTVQFAHDHWGAALTQSKPVEIDYSVPHLFAVDFGARFSAAGAGNPHGEQLTVAVDGQVVWSTPAVFFPADQREVFIGYNGIGGSTCLQYFSGALLSVDRVPAPRR